MAILNFSSPVKGKFHFPPTFFAVKIFTNKIQDFYLIIIQFSFISFYRMKMPIEFIHTSFCIYVNLVRQIPNKTRRWLASSVLSCWCCATVATVDNTTLLDVIICVTILDLIFFYLLYRNSFIILNSFFNIFFNSSIMIKSFSVCFMIIPFHNFIQIKFYSKKKWKTTIDFPMFMLVFCWCFGIFY